MLGLSLFGSFHTLISLVALAAGVIALVRYKGISWSNSTGKVYVVGTIATCVTGFGIFHHGGFGPPHALGVATLLALGGVALAARGRLFGRAARYVEIVGYTATLFFHMIPAVAETTTRLPVGAPLASSQDAPLVKGLTAGFFLLFAVIAVWQVRAERSRRREGSGAPARLGGSPVAATTR